MKGSHHEGEGIGCEVAGNFRVPRLGELYDQDGHELEIVKVEPLEDKEGEDTEQGKEFSINLGRAQSQYEVFMSSVVRNREDVEECRPLLKGTRFSDLEVLLKLHPRLFNIELRTSSMKRDIQSLQMYLERVIEQFHEDPEAVEYIQIGLNHIKRLFRQWSKIYESICELPILISIEKAEAVQNKISVEELDPTEQDVRDFTFFEVMPAQVEEFLDRVNKLLEISDSITDVILQDGLFPKLGEDMEVHHPEKIERQEEAEPESIKTGAQIIPFPVPDQYKKTG